jgi:S1-C subfamily serine protease
MSSRAPSACRCSSSTASCARPRLVGLDLRTDIAVIKVSAGGLRPSLRGDSAKIEQGDLVYAFGSPFDFRFSMQLGIVSGLGRSAGLADIDYENFIQTDAAINPGNSGGPLTDIRGRVIGMNTAIATGRGNSVGQGQFAGIGLAIPMSMIESVVSQIIEIGRGPQGLPRRERRLDRHGALACRARQPARGGRRGFPRRGRGCVGDVTPDSPASEAGFARGDVIVTIDGQKVTSEGSVPAVVVALAGRDGEVRRLARRRRGRRQAHRALDEGATLDMSLRVGIDCPRSSSAAGIAQFATATSERAAKPRRPVPPRHPDRGPARRLEATRCSTRARSSPRSSTSRSRRSTSSTRGLRASSRPGCASAQRVSRDDRAAGRPDRADSPLCALTASPAARPLG